jgi:hypothetical protein
MSSLQARLAEHDRALAEIITLSTETFFITTYALTKGILEIIGYTTVIGEITYVSNAQDKNRKHRICEVLGKKAFRTLIVARSEVNDAIIKKARSLNRQIEKLNAINVNTVKVVKV